MNAVAGFEDTGTQSVLRDKRTNWTPKHSNSKRAFPLLKRLKLEEV